MYKKIITVSPEDKDRINTLNKCFTDEAHYWLRNPRRFKDQVYWEIHTLYDKYMSQLKFGMFTEELWRMDMEKNERHTDVRKSWTKCYLLSWLCNYPDLADEDFFYNESNSRPAAGELIHALYRKVE